MDQQDNERLTAQELVSYARRHGVDLEALRNNSMFQNGQRWIILWRKRVALLCSGHTNEPEGTIHYSMQGTISVIPNSLGRGSGTLQRVWSEAGTLEDLEEAFGLMNAWLLDWKEIDDLPSRSVRRSGI